MVWARVQSTGNGPEHAVDLLEGFRADNGGSMPLGSTVTRVRGFGMASTDSTAPPSDLGVLWGLVVDSRRHTAAEVPLPSTEQHVDWMQWRWQPLTSTPIWSWEVDVKSMRKMEELEETLWLSATETGAGLSVTAVTWYLSVLIKLP